MSNGNFRKNHHKRHLLSHSASSGQLSPSINVSSSEASSNHPSSPSTQFAFPSSEIDSASRAAPLNSGSEGSAVYSDINGSPTRTAASLLNSPIKCDSYTNTSARLRRPSLGLMAASSSGTNTPLLGNVKTDNSSTNLSPRTLANYSTKSSPRNSFTSCSPYLFKSSSASGSQHMIIDSKPSYTSSSRLSSGEIIDVMEKEQDAIVLKLMKEINLLKEENKILKAQLNNPNFETARSRSSSTTKRLSTGFSEDFENSELSKMKKNRFSDSTSFGNYKLDASFGLNTNNSASSRVLSQSQLPNKLSSTQVPRSDKPASKVSANSNVSSGPAEIITDQYT